jgi:uncharacterized protein (DUF305 family)
MSDEGRLARSHSRDLTSATNPTSQSPSAAPQKAVTKVTVHLPIVQLVGLLHFVVAALPRQRVLEKEFTTMFKSIRPFATVLVAGTLLLNACGGGSDADSSETAPPGSIAAATDASFNDADVAFAQGMIPHHAQAVDMASIALQPESGASAEIQALATAIQGAQDPEIEMMTEWLQAWGQPMEMPGMEGMDDMSGMEGMEGMMTAEQMAALAGPSGPEFDTAWATMMIAHHQGAITQAETVKANGSDPEVLALADQIISAQQAEIAQMQAMLAS